MPVSNAHLKDTVRVWDGLSFRMMDKKEAHKAEVDGLLQVANNLSASDLKTAAEFNKAREAKPKRKTKTKVMKADTGLPLGDGKQTYKTREMKAE